MNNLTPTLLKICAGLAVLAFLSLFATDELSALAGRAGFDEAQILLTSLVRFKYALLGLGIGWLFLRFAWWRIDQWTAYDTDAELEKGNVAVGNMIAGIFIGLGLMLGLIIAAAIG